MKECIISPKFQGTSFASSALLSATPGQRANPLPGRAGHADMLKPMDHVGLRTWALEKRFYKRLPFSQLKAMLFVNRGSRYCQAEVLGSLSDPLTLIATGLNSLKESIDKSDFGETSAELLETNGS